MANKTSICNQALRLIGAQRISVITEDNEAARVLNDVYDNVRDEVLKTHPWNFAIKRDSLAEVDGDPEFEWGNWFQLPTNCLRVIKMLDNAKFVVEADKLLTNEGSAKIKYIAKITDESKFDATFVTAFAQRLAAEICYPITNSRTLTEQQYKIYAEKLKLAKSVDAQEGIVEAVEDSSWVDERK